MEEIMKATKRSKASVLAFFNVVRKGAGEEDANDISDLTNAEYKKLVSMTKKG